MMSAAYSSKVLRFPLPRLAELLSEEASKNEQDRKSNEDQIARCCRTLGIAVDEANATVAFSKTTLRAEMNVRKSN